MKKKLLRKVLSAGLVLVLALSLAACGSSSSSDEDTSSAEETDSSEDASSEDTSDSSSDIVNIGFSDALSSINPLNMSMSFVDLYASSLSFLPLVAYNSEYGVDSMIAESITTEDNLTFHITIRDDAYWSDGEPITADDVIYTILKISSPEVANYNFDFSRFLGFEDGTSPSGATEIEGLVKIDDKNLEMIATSEMSLESFYNGIATWICILPQHALEDIADEDLSTTDWFDNPTVVSGPYIVQDYDLLNYVSYTANENYFMGTPNISTLNIKIMDGSSLLTSLQSGELDMVHPSTAIPSTDQEALEDLEGYTITYSDNIINEMTFINTSTITDSRVRQAIVLAIDREALVESILSGHGEVTDSFICSASPYYNSENDTNSYDPDKAKELLEEAGWDESTVLTWNVNSGDESAILAVQIAQQQLAEVGITVEINTVDLATLQTEAGTEDVDLTSVQYTITPSDYYVDVQWLVDDIYGSGNWTGGYYNEELDAAIQATQTAVSTDDLQEAYDTMEELLLDQVPMFSLYFQSNPGVVSDRIENAEMTFYGAFNNVHEWTIAE